MGLCPRPCWGSLQHSQDLLLNLGKGGEERERKEMELGEEMEGRGGAFTTFYFTVQPLATKITQLRLGVHATAAGAIHCLCRPFCYKSLGLVCL